MLDNYLSVVAGVLSQGSCTKVHSTMTVKARQRVLTPEVFMSGSRLHRVPSKKAPQSAAPVRKSRMKPALESK